ncbi:MAG: YfiR family protein [Usitatibacter sp.]
MDLLIHTRRSALWLAAAAVAAFASSALAQQAAEAAVKAAFLYKFAGYVEWPDSALLPSEAPFTIGIIGADDVAAELDRLVPGRTVLNRRVVVRRVKEGEGLKGVHLLFIGRGEANPRALLRAAQQQGTLAVTESERGFELGSAINFVTLDDRIGFEVSLESAEKSGLRISSRMLAVARRVVARQ